MDANVIEVEEADESVEALEARVASLEAQRENVAKTLLKYSETIRAFQAAEAEEHEVDHQQMIQTERKESQLKSELLELSEELLVAKSRILSRHEAATAKAIAERLPNESSFVTVDLLGQATGAFGDSEIKARPSATDEFSRDYGNSHKVGASIDSNDASVALSIATMEQNKLSRLMYQLVNKDKFKAITFTGKASEDIVEILAEFERVCNELAMTDKERLTKVKDVFIGSGSSTKARDFVKYGTFADYQDLKKQAYDTFHGSAHLEEAEDRLLGMRQGDDTAMDYYNRFKIAMARYQFKLSLAVKLDPSIDADGRRLSDYQIKQAFLRNMNETDKKRVVKHRYGTMQEIKKQIDKMESERRALREFAARGNQTKTMRESFLIENGGEISRNFESGDARYNRESDRNRNYNQNSYRGYRGYRGRAQSGRDYRGYDRRSQACRKCGESGHRAADCPNRSNVHCDCCGQDDHATIVCYANPESPFFRRAVYMKRKGMKRGGMDSTTNTQNTQNRVDNIKLKQSHNYHGSRSYAAAARGEGRKHEAVAHEAFAAESAPNDSHHEIEAAQLAQDEEISLATPTTTVEAQPAEQISLTTATTTPEAQPAAPVKLSPRGIGIIHPPQIPSDLAEANPELQAPADYKAAGQPILKMESRQRRKRDQPASHGPNCAKRKYWHPASIRPDGIGDEEREIRVDDIECDCEMAELCRRKFDVESNTACNGEAFVVNSLEFVDDAGRQMISLHPAESKRALSMLADTGSTVSLCSRAAFEQFEGAQVRGSYVEQVTGIGGSVGIRDYLLFTFQHGRRVIKEKFFVVDGLKHGFIASRMFLKLNGYVLQRVESDIDGYHHFGTSTKCPSDADEVFWAKLGSDDDALDTDKILFGVKLSQKARETVKRLFAEYQTASAGNPKLGEFPDFEFEIKFHDESKVCKQRPFVLSRAQRVEMARQINELLEQGLVKKSSSDFASPAFLVTNPNKPDKKPRLVVDYRQINAWTVKDAYPMPDMKEINNRCKGCRYFSKFDVKAGFYHMVLSKDASRKLAFHCPDSATTNGLYEPVMCPFGPTNGPPKFQRMMHRIFGDIEDVHVFIDDILVASKSEETHIRAIKEICRRAQDHNVLLAMDKCEIGRSRIEFLGQQLTADGIVPTPFHQKKALNLVRPKGKSDIKTFMGLANWIGDHIMNLSDIVAPISRLQRDSVPFVWSAECEAAFERFKEAVRNAAILKYPDFTRPFQLVVDASDRAIGAALLQKNDEGKTQIVEFYSRLFTEAEKNWHASTKEAYAIVAPLEHFRKYLLPQHTVIYTDHSNHQILFDTQKPQSAPSMSSKLWRWATRIQDFDFTVKYVAGAKNGLADFISRPYEDNLSHLIDHVRDLDEPVEYKPEHFVNPESYHLYFAGTEHEADDSTKRDSVMAGQPHLSGNVNLSQVLETFVGDADPMSEHGCDACKSQFRWEIEAKRRSCRVCKTPTWRHVEIVNLCKCSGIICSGCVALEPLWTDLGAEVLCGLGTDPPISTTKPRRQSWFDSFSLEEFILAQQQDAKLKHIVAGINQPGPNRSRRTKVSKIDSRRIERGNYKIDQHGVLRLYTTWNVGADEGRIVVPRKYVDQILDFYHGQLHDGRDRLLLNMEHEVYWYGMSADIREHCRRCKQCQGAKGAPGKIEYQLFPSYTFNDMVSVDVVGPLPRDEFGYAYTLTMIDRFSRLLHIIPIKSEAPSVKEIGAEILADAIYRFWICKHGPMEQLLSDKGSQFTSAIFGELEKCTGFKQRFTTPYHPECNGMLENKHRWIKQRIVMLSNANPRAWSRLIAPIEYGYNTSKNQMTGSSPHEIVYAYKAKSQFRKLLVKQPSKHERFEFLKRLQDLDTDTRRAHALYEQEAARARKAKELREFNAIQHQNEYDVKRWSSMNQNRKTIEFNEGDYVLQFIGKSRVGNKRKLSQNWIGPFQIVEKLSAVNYRLARSDRRNAIVHAAYLKEYHE